MNRGLLFYLHGIGHATQLLISLHALRSRCGWTGPVAIAATDPTGPALSIATALDAQVVPFEFEKLSRNSAMVAKTVLPRVSPFDPTIYMDADTIPVSDLTELWPTRLEQIVFACFSDWNVATNPAGNSSPYRARVERFATLAGCGLLLRKRLAENGPAVNNGVLAFWRDAEVLEPVHELARNGHRAFIPDECAYQLLYPDYPCRLVDDRWNHSPRHGRHPEDVRVHHCHGSKHLHRRTAVLWLGLFAECWERNLAGVQDWIPETERVTYLPRIAQEATR